MNGRRTVLERAASVPFTETDTEKENVGTTPTPRRGTVSGTLRHLPAEARLLASEAYAVWRDTATKQANPYVDHSMCLLAGRMAIEATRWEDGLVILAAIRDRMDAKSSPRRIPEWARLQGSEKREREHVERKRAEASVPVDPDVRSALSAAWKAMDPRTARTWSRICEQQGCGGSALYGREMCAAHDRSAA